MEDNFTVKMSKSIYQVVITGQESDADSSADPSDIREAIKEHKETTEWHKSYDENTGTYTDRCEITGTYTDRCITVNYKRIK